MCKPDMKHLYLKPKDQNALHTTTIFPVLHGNDTPTAFYGKKKID
jgi:hypothetical protein